MIKTILHIGVNDLRLAFRDRSGFLWMMILPLGMMWLFGNSFRAPTDEQPKIHLTVVDHDGGWLARAFIDQLADESVNLQELTAEDFASAETKVRSLIIPAGFTEQVLAGEQQTVRLEKEAGSNQEFGLAGQMHIVRSIVRTLAGLVEADPSGAGNVPVEALRQQFQDFGDRESLVTLEVSTAGKGRPVPGGFGQSVPGSLTMVVMMMTIIYGAVLLTSEKSSGMLKRLAGAPVGRGQVYLGKLVGRLLIAAAQLAVLTVAGPLLFDFDWGASLPGLAVLLISYAVAVAGLSTLVGAWLSTPKQASAVGWILSMGLASLGGCWWPSEVMPNWLQTAALALPTSWAMQGFHGLITWGRGFEAALLPSAVLLGFGALFAVMGAKVLRWD